MEEQQDIVRLVEEFQADDDAFRTVLEARQAKELRSACVRLGIRVQGKAMTESMLNNKAGYIDLICKHRRSLDATSGYTPPPVHSRSTRHCIFRLLNVLFSDEFAERLHEADGTPARAAASDAETDHDKGDFWADVEKTYTSRDPSFDSLITWRPSYAPIQPSKAASHSASKLKEMWKQHVTRYSIALAPTFFRFVLVDMTCSICMTGYKYDRIWLLWCLPRRVGMVNACLSCVESCHAPHE
uniref:Uncharacterized protein n=1 Tax=Globisporangium ultimum (strain ATCC 200006 / CBS 805.95 / DAOM BR144) TaxID=431595 RepID=K3X1V4_GLOUD